MKFFKSSRKYFALFFLCLFLVLAAGFFTPIMVQYRQNNWKSEVSERVRSIESSIISDFKSKQRNLINSFSHSKFILLQLNIKDGITPDPIKKILDENKLNDYSIEILDKNGNILYWHNTVVIPEEKFLPLKYKPGEIHFHNSDLITYLTMYDSLNSHWIILSQPIEKHYNIYNNFYEKISLESEYSEKYSSIFDIEYSPVGEKTNDGRKHSFDIRNNFNRKIGVVTFDKPARDVEINRLKESFFDFQSILVIIGFFFLGCGFYADVKHLKNKTIKIVIIAIFLAAFRFLLFILKFPSRFIEGSITNSAFFASTFGYGIVRSPVELFITVIFLLIVCIFIYERIVKSGIIGKMYSNSYSLYSVLLILSSLLFFILFRGLAASIKSVIFDSSLRYFKEPGLIPNFPAGIMEFNVLLLGLASVLISVTIILLLIKTFPERDKKRKTQKFYWLLFIILQITGVLYDYFQKDPQGTPIIRILYVTFIFIVTYRLYFRSFINNYNYVYFSIVASITTISLLNFYNSSLERESLKTTAFELTRTNDDLLQFLVRETLLNASSKEEVIKLFKESNINYGAKAFLIWSQSAFQRDNLNSSISLLNKEKQLLGSFGIGLEELYRVGPNAVNYEGTEVDLLNYQVEKAGGTIITGITPIKEGSVTLGYIVASILYNPGNFRLNNYPRFIAADYNPINSTVDFNNLKIFDFSGNELVNVFGDITPANEHIEILVNNEDLKKNNEAWSNININNENYIAYILKVTETGKSRILSVLLREKNLSWSLYNFLKVFFIHSFIIAVLLVIIYLFQVKKERNIRYTFKTQLLVAFLVVSVFPIIFLAFYNRSITSKKNSEYVFLELKKNALLIEDYVNNYIDKNPDKDIRLAFKNSAADLNIDFSVFSKNKLYYSSHDEFYRSGLISNRIIPAVFTKLNDEGYKEYPTGEMIENYSFNSLYNKVSFNGSEYIIKINDAFNKVSVQLTGEEVNIFLFGSYSLAMILVIIFSAVLANKISSPIRSLTKATASVASGDLDYEVKLNYKGEIKELINGFNFMIRQLKKNQVELGEMEREIAWKEMARQVAHEIKNPLTPMKLAVQQLVIAYKDKSVKFDAIFEKVTKTVISQIETLNNIASEFSSFARMPNLKMENLDIRLVIDDAVNLFLEEKVKINVNKYGIYYKVAADKDQLKRTLINLIRNSIQAGASSIIINLYEDNELVNLEIADNGSGIPAENLNRVFEPNFSTKEKGMGLGLKMAKKFIEGIKGKICIVESNSSGTKFLLQIPKVIE